MSWFLLILISVLLASIVNILQKVLMKDTDSDPRSYAVFFCFLLGFLNLIFALFFGFQFPLSSVNLIFFVIASVLWGMGLVFLFKALQLLESSEVTILTSARSLITIIAAIIFLHESFNVQKILGTIIVLSSILLLSNLKQGVKFNKGVMYSFGMALCYGLAVIFDSFNIKNYDPISYLAVENFLIGFILLMLYPKTTQQWGTFIKLGFLKKMLPLGIFSTTQAIAYYFALKNGPVSQIAPINQAQVIVTVLLAVMLLREKDNLTRKLIAAVLVTVGVILLR